jgi:hypothetical protein
MGGDPHFVLRRLPVPSSRAVVAGACIDLVENDQAAFFVCYFAMIQTVNMITTMAMNCSSTRSRMSFCDV